MTAHIYFESMDMTGELWIDIYGYEGRYQISNLGRIKLLAHTRKRNGGIVNVKGKIMKQSITNGGYMKIVLFRNNKKVNLYTHRLVAIHFLENRENKREVNHLDANKKNNNVLNLEWSTTKENSAHAWKNGLIKKVTGMDSLLYGKRGAKSPLSKKVKQITPFGEIIKWDSITEASNKIGVSISSLSGCLKGRQKTSAGCRWEYSN